MKNLSLLCIYLTVAMSACHKNNIPHYPLSAMLKSNFGYGVGSYWVYRDSVSGEIDSFYTYYSNFWTENGGDALVDRMDIYLKNHNNGSPNDSEIWLILLMDSTFSISFENSRDYVEAELNINLFTFPFSLESLLKYGEDSGYINEVLPAITLNGLQFNNTVVSVHKNVSNRVPLIIYNDVYFISQSAGPIKIVFNHPQDSVYRVLELQRYNIAK